VNRDAFIQQAQKAPPIDCEAFYAQAYAKYQSGQSTEAAEIFSVLCSRQPMEFRNWFGLGASLQEGSKNDQALYAWAMAALLDPPNPYPHFHAAQCARSLGNLDDAMRALLEAKERVCGPTHPLHATIAQLEELWRIR
jgi:type III secretion system low calcium response chaperone LcrH/SycD